MKNKLWIIIALLVVAALIGYRVMKLKPETTSEEDHAEGEEYEHGPHGGRLLKDGDFSLEVTIYEENTPPQFRFYAYKDEKPVAAAKVQARAVLTRLDGEVNNIGFAPEGDYLKGDATVHEPHSFDVAIEASDEGKQHHWKYASYEGRTSIEAGAAQAAGVKVEQTGAATIHETIPLTGRVVLNRNATANVRARFSGVVREVKVEQGQSVAKGDVLARVESNDSLQVYSVKSPIAGIVLSRETNIGDVAGEAPLFVIADLSQMWAEFHVFSRDAALIAVGQKVTVANTDGSVTGEGTIAALLPVAESATQTIIARVPLENANNVWRSGMTINGKAVVAEHEVPLAVKTSGLQRFRDFTVVFLAVGDTYEVRMLELGKSDGEQTEVLSGIQPGQSYVSENSFLIKADIEKSGASHDH